MSCNLQLPLLPSSPPPPIHCSWFCYYIYLHTFFANIALMILLEVDKSFKKLFEIAS